MATLVPWQPVLQPVRSVTNIPQSYAVSRGEHRMTFSNVDTKNDAVVQLLRKSRQTQSAPTEKESNLTFQPPRNATQTLSNFQGEGRIFFNLVADLIQASGFFPITINVPDSLSAMGEFITHLPGISQVVQYFSPESEPRKKKKKKKNHPHGQPSAVTVNSQKPSAAPKIRRRISKQRIRINNVTRVREPPIP